MKMPPIVSPEQWEAERQELLVEEKALTRATWRGGRQAPADAVDGGREGVPVRWPDGSGDASSTCSTGDAS